MTARVLSSDGVQIAFDAAGSGRPALVFVHGWSCNRTHWQAQLRYFSPTAFVAAIDLGGHGESGDTRQVWSIASFGADVSSVVDHLALDDIVLVGHSMGANVVLEAARRLEGRVRALIWVDQFHQLTTFLDQHQVQQRLNEFRFDFPGTTERFVRRLFAESADPVLVERVAAQMSASPVQVALPTLEATWNHAREVPTLLSSLRVPVTAINSRTPSTDIASMRHHGVGVVLLPRAGHFPMLERPAHFNACLQRVLRRFGRAA